MGEPAHKQEQDQRQRDEIQWVLGLLVSAQNRDWYGQITIEIKHGLIHLVRQEETLKMGQLGLHGPPKSL